MANLFFLGDSIIEFHDWQKEFPDHRAVNLGRAGETAEELLARLDTILALQPPPDWLLVMTGTNNVCMEDFTFPSTIAEIIESAQARLPATTITVNSLLPIELPYLAENTVARTNAIIQEIATSRHVHFLDGHAALTDQSGHIRPGVLSLDGVHLGEYGYRLWALEIEKHLQTLLPFPPLPNQTAN